MESGRWAGLTVGKVMCHVGVSHSLSCMAVYNRWTGLVDWTGGLDYDTYVCASSPNN